MNTFQYSGRCLKQERCNAENNNVKQTGVMDANSD